jgi:hypothetical protein
VHETHEWNPSVTHDGRLVYTRWDYVDRDAAIAHLPWVTTLDGRDARALHGNFSPRRLRPDMELDVRAIPGSHKYVATAAAHHGHAFGSLVILDPKQIASISPIPLRPRPAPPVAPSELSDLPPGRVVRIPGTEQVVSVDGKPAEAVMAVLNVYERLKPWPDGAQVKALRIVQIVPMSVPSQVTYDRRAPEIGCRLLGDFPSVVLARQVVGTVPVEADGSAHFSVPAHKEVFFQVLDERGLALQSMRSGTYAHPGERLVCQGCHEPKHQAPLNPASVPIALRRPPSRPVPDVDGSNPFSYPRLVQPVLDQHCVACHAKSGGKAMPLGRDPIQNQWFASYVNLAPKYGFIGYGNPHRTVPGRFGARASKRFEILDKGHHGLQLPEADLHRIALWLDCCSVFYGVYEKDGGEAQLRGEVVRPTLE